MKECNRDILKYLGKRMRYYRRFAQLTQEQAAQALGCCRRTLISYEQGKHETTVDTLIKMAELYNISIDILTDYKTIELDVVPYHQLQKSED